MTRFICLLFCLFHLSAHAQSNALDGNWLKQGLDAYDRAYVTHTGSTDDTAKGEAVISFLIGMVAVHRQNNFMALFMWSNVKKTTDKTGKVKPSEEDKARIETAAIFTPLRSLPDNLAPEQFVAILLKYLNDHPEKWGTSAPILVTEALSKAFRNG